jgi:hypothetical protein
MHQPHGSNSASASGSACDHPAGSLSCCSVNCCGKQDAPKASPEVIEAILVAVQGLPLPRALRGELIFPSLNRFSAVLPDFERPPRQ